MHLGEDGKWWREDGVRYSLDGHKPSTVHNTVSPLIRMRKDTVVRIDGVLFFEYEDGDPRTSYLHKVGTKGHILLMDGEAFLAMAKEAQAQTEDCGWLLADNEIFVYKAFPLDEQTNKAAWRAFFWHKRRECLKRLHTLQAA